VKIFWFVPDLESARGLAQSKTWRKLLRSVTRVSVLEYAGPPALFPARSKAHDSPPNFNHARTTDKMEIEDFEFFWDAL
jgi:hypothetical protein